MELGAPIPAVVLDASYIVEALEGDPRYRESWATMAESGTMQFVPAHFWPEVANALLRSLGISAAEVMRRLERLATSGIEVADRGLPGLTEAVELAQRHRLSVYDAVYLQLALDIDATLASLDADLVRAAHREGLTVIG